MTIAEFLDWDDGTDRRYQLVDGVAVMKAPTLEAHGELVVNLGAEIRSRLSPPCRVVGEAGVTIPDRADTCYIADLAVTCAPREPGRRMVAEPVVIVEILSPSTDQVDRWRKVADYRTLASVQEIVVVFSDERRVEVQRRAPNGWRVEDLIAKAEIRLSCCNDSILINAIYHGVLADDAKAPNTPNVVIQNASQQNFDRLPSIMLLQNAADYILSSHLLNEKRNELDQYFGMPAFFLCAHAFELLLKAFLRAKGWPIRKLKPIFDSGRAESSGFAR